MNVDSSHISDVTSVPIDRLPSELLTKIFALVPSRLSIQPDPSYGSGRPVRTADLVPITAVCRWWREIALGTSSLWTTFTDYDFDSTSPVPMYTHYLHRSGTTPLVVYLTRTPSETISNALRSEASRIQEFYAVHVILDTRKAHSLVHLFLPNIEYCVLSFWHDSHPGCTSTIPFFGGRSPRLRTLMLIDPAAMPSNQFPALTHLRLSFILFAIRLRYGYAFERIVELLSRTPQLRVLELMGLASSDVAYTEGRTKPTTLRLQYLEKLIFNEEKPMVPGHAWREHFTTVQWMLSNISIPDSCAISFSWLPPGPVDRYNTTFPKHQSVTHLRIRRHRPGAFGISTMVPVLDATNPSTGQSLMLGVYGPVSAQPGPKREKEVRELRAHLQRTLPAMSMFTAVRKLWIDATMSMIFHSSTPFLPSLPGLEMLVIRQGAPDGISPRAEDILSALVVQGEDGGAHAGKGDGRGTVGCPLLAVLLVDCVYDEEEYVYDVARGRAEAGFPLRRLFVGSDAGLPLAYKLREYVDGTLVGVGGEEIAGELWKEWCLPE